MRWVGSHTAACSMATRATTPEPCTRFAPGSPRAGRRAVARRARARLAKAEGQCPTGCALHPAPSAGAARGPLRGAWRCAPLRFLVRYFHTRTLLPFVVYSLVAGVISLVHFA